MHGSELKNTRHSTPEPPSRPQLWTRVIGSLALFGFLIGMMLGRLQAPEPLRLERVEVQADQLQLWFNEQPRFSGEQVQGALALRFEAQGRAQQGQLDVAGRRVNWRLLRGPQGLSLNLVGARPLRGEWHGAAVRGGWRLTVSLREE
ncbi:MAG: hypothetical protein ABWY06_16460 [Pseudomonas sp.]|uniref:hypothetical protein n=1 Tax=Pseudomonas sp. TaxID=306 RepID=UPI003397393B